MTAPETVREPKLSKFDEIASCIVTYGGHITFLSGFIRSKFVGKKRAATTQYETLFVPILGLGTIGCIV